MVSLFILTFHNLVINWSTHDRQYITAAISQRYTLLDLNLLCYKNTYNFSWYKWKTKEEILHNCSNIMKINPKLKQKCFHPNIYLNWRIQCVIPCSVCVYYRMHQFNATNLGWWLHLFACIGFVFVCDKTTTSLKGGFNVSPWEFH